MEKDERLQQLMQSIIDWVCQIFRFSFFCLISVLLYLEKKEYSFTDVRRICAQLSACGLLLLDKSSNSIAKQSVRLSMPIHLLIFALKNTN